MDEGAEDIEINDKIIEISLEYQELAKFREIVDTIPELETKKSEIVQIPNSSVDLNDSESSKLLKLLSDLEDLDDVTKVFSSANFSEKSIEEFALG